MPSSATITSFYNFTANTRARATQVNTNFDAFRGHLVPIEPLTSTSSNVSYDLGSDEHRWRTSYVNRVDFDRYTSTAINFIEADSATSAINVFLDNSLMCSFIRAAPYRGLSNLSLINLSTTLTAYIVKDVGTTTSETVFVQNGTESFRVIEGGFKSKNYKTFDTSVTASVGQLAQSGVIAMSIRQTTTITPVANSTMTISTIGRPVLFGTRTFADTTFTGFYIDGGASYAVDVYRDGAFIHRMRIGGNAAIQYPASSIHFIDFHCNAGTHTYQLYYLRTGGTANNLEISNFYLNALEL